MRMSTLASAAVAMLTTASLAHAQVTYVGPERERRFGIEGRASAAIPTDEFRPGTDLNTGYGFEATARYRFFNTLSLYGGWNWHRFNADEPLAGTGDANVEGRAFSYGIRHDGQMMRGTNFWLRAGGTAGQLRVENDAGGLVGDTGYDPGWEVGAGLNFDLAGGWQLSPGVQYRALDRDIMLNGTTVDSELRYVTLGIGLTRMF